MGAPDDTLPQRIGKYRVLGRLGQGATSEVVLAYDDFLSIEVAIKRLRRDALAGEHEARLQSHVFAAEAALVGRLWHPNIVRIYDAVADADPPYLVMEVVKGTTLRSFCRADRLLPLEQVVEAGFKCALALNHVHRLGVIHRDIKPANLLAKLDGDRLVDVKVSDFGSAFITTADRTQIFRVGSLAYMSPEQIEGETLDCRTDIYSLAATLYHLVAGRPPFDGPQQEAVMYQVLHVEPTPLSTLRDGVPDSLQALLSASLAKSRADRPASWLEFARRLSVVVADREVPRAEAEAVLDSERFNLLRALDFFADFGDVELWEVVHRAVWRRHAAGDAIYRRGDSGDAFHVVAEGEIEVWRGGQCVASLGPGTTVGEMAYLAPDPSMREHSVDVFVSRPATTIDFTPQTMALLSPDTQHRFDKAFNRVLVRRLRAAHEALMHPRKI